MRILRYHPRAAAGDGGMSNAMRRWSTALADQGADVAIGYDAAAGAPRTGVPWIGIRHATLGNRRLPRDMGPVLAGFDLLVLHGGWTAANIVAARAARSARIPYLLEPRGAYDPHIVARRRLLKRGWWLTLEREMVRGACGVHLFFASELPHLAALGLTVSTVVVPNGVDVPTTPTWDGGSGGFVLWYGRFDLQHKGLDALVEGLAHVPERCRPAIRLHGPDQHGDRDRLAGRIEALRLSKWATIGDAMYGPAKEDLLARCAAFAYPSRWEGFGIAPGEAVARGVPLLATPYPFARSLADQGGAIVVPATPEALSEGLAQVVRPEAAEVGARGRQVVAEQYRWDDVARSWLRQVESLL
jgi:glycosyltransferase involved in cell wall biosynthesis